MTIPKIIHQIAPKNESDWHPLWKFCYSSWKENFPESEYTHILWNDENDIDNLIEEHYPDLFDFYNNLPFHLLKIDFAKICILYKHGGIYSDMDIFCYSDFYNELSEDTYILQSTCGKEIVQNSLMVSSPKNNFFKYCIDNIILEFKQYPKEKINSAFDHQNKKEIDSYMLGSVGPIIISKLFLKYGLTEKNMLPAYYYNNHHFFYDETIKTRHMLTGLWGKDLIEYEKNLLDSHNFDIPMINYRVNQYKHFRGIDLNNFNFYKNYF
jgi:mannosyltransferase OCH1-like enzyme